MAWKKAVTDMLRIAYPIIQAPMLGVTTPEMVAAASNAGGLGSLPVGGLSPGLTQALIRKTRSLTNKPFAVNLFAHEVPTYADEDLEPMRQLLLQLAAKRNFALDTASLSNFQLYTYQDQIDILINEGISVISFTFGCLDAASIRRLKEKDSILIGTATCVEEAEFLEQQHTDIICVQGIEAGGHRGTFMADIPLPQIGLFTLLPQINERVQTALVAAGGINNAQTIRAAFDLGADAVQPGTIFIATAESSAIASHKNLLATATGNSTCLTRSFTGRWARGFRNQLMEAIEQSGIAIPPYPWQNSLTGTLRKLAQQQDDGEYTNMWAGQAAGSVAHKTTAAVMRNLVDTFEANYSSEQ